jgi:hypothetical protein
VLLKRSWHPTRLDIEDIKSTFEELCRGVNYREILTRSTEQSSRRSNRTFSYSNATAH